jgi:hypothetical protein
VRYHNTQRESGINRVPFSHEIGPSGFMIAAGIGTSLILFSRFILN